MFYGGADVVSGTGQTERIPPSDLARLDAFEGVPWAYRRRRVSLHDATGPRRRAQAYVMPLGRARRSPGSKYLLTILGAYDALGFDTAPLLRAAFSETP